jgi:small-conductance mechanosensitive channel
MSLKIAKFVNEKITFLILAGMLMVVLAGHEKYGTDSFMFFAKVADIFLCLWGMIAAQATIVFIINKFFTKLGELTKGNSRSKLASKRIKDLTWTCDVVVLSIYFLLLCLIVNFLNVDIGRYIFYDNFVKIAWILLIATIAYKGIHKFENAVMEKAENENRDYYLKLQTFLPVISVIFDIILLLTAVLIGLANFNISVTPILAAFSIFGAAVGLAAKDTIQAFLSGVTLLIERNLYVGELVVVNGIKGIVEKLSIRVMHLRSKDGGVHIIPYNFVGAISNYSGEYKRYFDDLHVLNTNDVPKVTEILKKIIEDMKKEDRYSGKIIGDVIIRGIKPFDLTGIRIFWEIVTTPDVEELHIKCDVYSRLLKVYDKQKIEIPKISNISTIHQDQKNTDSNH